RDAGRCALEQGPHEPFLIGTTTWPSGLPVAPHPPRSRPDEPAGPHSLVSRSAAVPQVARIRRFASRREPRAELVPERLRKVTRTSGHGRGGRGARFSLTKLY